MSWLRNMKRRLQQLEKNSDELQDSYSFNKDSNETEQRTTFRFPIVSDNEIHGGPPEEIMDPASHEGLEEDSGRIPLHQNSRWPGRHEEEGKIYRSAARLPAHGTPEQKQKQQPFKDQPANPAVKSAAPKSKRPFSPTEVPSPIYGYSKSSPILLAMEEAKGRRKEEQASELIGQPIEEISVSDSEELLMDEPQYEESEEMTVAADRSEPAEEPIVPVHENTDAASSAEEQSDEVDLHAAVVTVLPDLEIDGQEAQEESPEAAEEPELHTQKAEPEIQLNEEPSLDEETSDSPMEEQPSEDRLEDMTAEPKEKIVPFNVLMLQSDKDKLAMKQMVPAIEEREETIPETVSSVVTASAKHAEPVKPEIAEELPAETPASEIEDAPPPYYGFPSMQYLAPPEEEVKDEEWLQSQSLKLEETLSHFSIQASVVEAVQGPAVTMFELTVEQGTKVSKIRNLTDDLKLALAARDIRIQAPIPGTSLIGIEIPNRQTRAVRISEVIGSETFQKSDSPLEAVLGLSLTGEPQTIDLRKMPHGMIAGATGSGKSVCINSLLISLLYKASYHDLKLLLIDPKMVELAPYNGIPHLLSPVITDVKAATAALKWAVDEMERRYELFAHSAVRNIERYNELVISSRRFSLKMPYILIVIDELADLMMMAPGDVEVSISRITQKARACGIHLIIATQRPSVDVITGTIKANIPTRIAFAVSSQVDSRTILDTVGAERLLGKGDMLYLGNGQSAPVRLQGTFVTDDEIERIIEHVRNEAEPEYLFGQEDLLATAVQEEETDPLFQEACSFIIEQGSASTSLLQRHFSIGYNRAAKLIDRMEAKQFISEQKGSKPRDVFLTEQAFENQVK